MCGIYGSVGFSPDKSRIDIVAHRGPDGSGWLELAAPAGPVALGHRRLAIIDVSDSGLQPMADPTGRYQLVYNGELYNYLELREELKAKGEVFHTESDSEVLLRAYAVWGEAALDRCRGMFALLIWDTLKKRLFAARDRFGIKPLYMVSTESGVAFASEIKQLLGLPGVSGRLNVPRVHDFLAAGVCDHTAETMFADVFQLRGGECAVVDASRSGRIVAEIRRWYAVANERISITESEAAERFRALLSESVNLHLRSDVPVGSCLSGGLDSSSIVCLMAGLLGTRNGGTPLNTVSACYPNKSVDEKPFMDQVVGATASTPHFVFPRAEDVFARASDITWHQDEPFGSTSIFAQWCVFEEAKRAGIKVMLDGQGADEQLAGYHSSFYYYMSDLVRNERYLLLARTMLQRNRYHGVPLTDQMRQFLLPFLPAFAAQALQRKSRELAPIYWMDTPLLRESGNAKGAFQTAIDSLDLAPATDIDSLCRILTYSSNLQLLLHWEDRNSMAHSIEARVPFVDHQIIEFSLSLGGDHKIVGGDTKRVLRSAMKGILPEGVRQRRDKLGFATPEEIWMRGPLKGQMLDGIEASIKRFPELLEANNTRALARDMLEGERPVDFSLWRIVNLGIWGERFGVTL
jgi:asparagine synthase (glutamine-hydrolysing)